MTLRNKRQWNLNQNVFIFIQENAFEMSSAKLSAILSRPQCIKGHWLPLHNPDAREIVQGDCDMSGARVIMQRAKYQSASGLTKYCQQ